MRIRGLLFSLIVILLVGACTGGGDPGVQVAETVIVETRIVKETVIVEITPEAGESAAATEEAAEATREATEEAAAEGSETEASTEEGEPQYGGTLNMSLGPDFVTFHPYFDVTNAQFKPIFFEAPIRISDEGGFEPWLAESWEESEDGLSLTLYLQEGIMFHNGREMTADDVIWSVEHAMDTEPGHHLSDRFQDVAGATAIDDYTVEITYNEVTPKLDAIATMQIFPQEALDDLETVPVGTGPFKFEEWVPGDQLVAARFEEYWQEGLPYLDEVVVKPIPDEQSRMLNLMTGNIDLLKDVPLVDKALLDDYEGVTVVTSPPGFMFYSFLMNINEPPFDDVLVRQAMNYAIDREKIRQTAFHGEAITFVEPYPETSWAYSPELADYYTYDPDRARELLAEAGYPDGFKTTMLIRGTDGPYLDMAQVYQQDLAEIGVEVEILPTELPQYWPKLIDSEFSIVSHGTGDTTVDPSGLFEGAACCRPFRNFFGITDNDTWFPEYEALVTQGGQELDQEERQVIYEEALNILMEQGWTIGVAWRQEVWAFNDHVKGLRTDMGGWVWLDKTWLAE